MHAEAIDDDITREAHGGIITFNKNIVCGWNKMLLMCVSVIYPCQ